MVTRGLRATRSAIVWTMRLSVMVMVLVACDSSTVCMRDHRGVSASDHRACSSQFDAPIGSGADEECFCNVLTQTGCNVGKMCTWIHDQDVPPLGHICCAPEGTKQLGEACADAASGSNGYDDCARGTHCVNGTCAAICDLQSGNPTCDATHACVPYLHDFEVGGTYAAGVCEP